ncbi:MAG: hypothetical protein OXM61_05050 [Candidatus Poribacteria bacterium]|nr:hypothetical protein [Candidatus Poribacteria bacterium]
MKFEGKHKQFAVKCFAQFMTRTEVTDAFLEEFANVRLAHNILKQSQPTIYSNKTNKLKI